MQTTGPTLARIAAMVVFALSCFGLLLFLWLAFGGPIPLQPKGYRFQASFTEATQLSQEADVRISGVPVGKVKKIEPDKRTGRSLVEIEMQSRFAPVRSDARAILRQKTLLGETYVELTPGTRGARPIQEGGMLAAGRVSPTVELDEILRTFDEPTRRRFQVWMQSQAQAIDGRGRDLNDALGNLGPFAEDASTLVDILNRQEGAVSRLVSNTGEVFGALTEREGQLRELIENSNDVFRSTASRNRELQEAFIALPTFERESRQTLDRLTRFARDTDPLVDQLRPAARELSPTLTELERIAPDFRAFFRALTPLIDASRRGLPAGSRVLDDLRPLLAQLDPALRQVNPILDFVGLYPRELTAFFANSVAATQANPPGERYHYLRTTNPLNPENLAVYPNKVGTNRPNAYGKPGASDRLSSGLEVFDDRGCSRPTPRISSSIPSDLEAILGRQLIDQVIRFVYPNGQAPAPACRKQAPYDFSGERTEYPHVRAR